MKRRWASTLAWSAYSMVASYLSLCVLLKVCWSSSHNPFPSAIARVDQIWEQVLSATGSPTHYATGLQMPQTGPRPSCCDRLNNLHDERGCNRLRWCYRLNAGSTGHGLHERCRRYPDADTFLALGLDLKTHWHMCAEVVVGTWNNQELSSYSLGRASPLAHLVAPSRNLTIFVVACQNRTGSILQAIIATQVRRASMLQHAHGCNISLAHGST